jgi:nitrite reductase/ring-hydroxylating ferredoxin subunit
MTDSANRAPDESTTNYEVVARTGDFESTRMLSVSIKDRQVLICQTEEGYFAVDNICTHADARLDQGRLRGVRVICPLHGAAFDVRDGKALTLPATRALRSYPVQVVADEIRIAVEGAFPSGRDR